MSLFGKWERSDDEERRKRNEWVSDRVDRRIEDTRDAFRGTRKGSLDLRDY